MFEGYPRGWFCIDMSNELKAGDVKPLRYFGQDMVLFRGENGDPIILDAFCPHLGAHLGHGGKVEGNTIRCPFHAWKFDASGACVEIPYAQKIPKRACVRAWPVTERNGMVLVWHDPNGDSPTWEIPIMPEYGDAAWTPWRTKLLFIKTHPREVVENLADSAHFPRVHGTHVDQFENIYEGHVGTQITKGTAYPRGGGKDHFSLRTTYYGPGYQITEMAGYLENRLMLVHTPIDEGSIHLRFGVSLKVQGTAEKTEAFLDGYVKNLQIGFEEDIAIWENKCYREQPTLCDGDGPIGRLRKWYRQFYENPTDSTPPDKGTDETARV